MVMAQPRTASSAPDGKTRLGVFSLRRMEVLLQVCYHTVAWVAVCAQESVVVADTVQTLAHFLLRELLALVFGYQSLNGALFSLDVSLNLPSRTAFRINFLSGDCDEVIA